MIEVGDYYLCLEDVKMIDYNERVYTKGKVYKSEVRECLTNDAGNKKHYWPDDSEYYNTDSDIFKKHFIKISNPYKKRDRKLIDKVRNDTNS